MKRISSKILVLILIIEFLLLFSQFELSAQTLKFLDKSLKDKKSNVDAINQQDIDFLSSKLSNILLSNHPDLFRNKSDKKLPDCFDVSNQSILKNQFSIQNTNSNKYNLNPVTTYFHNSGTPKFMTGFPIQNENKNKSIIENNNIVNKALNILSENKSLFKLNNPVNELKIQKDFMDSDGNRHINFEQYYENIPVWGKEITMHFDKNNNLYLINSIYIPTPEDINLNISISQMSAINNSIENLQTITKIEEISDLNKKLLDYSEPTAQKCIWVDDNTGKSRVAWFVNIRPDIIHNWYYFIDANSGQILEKFDNSPSDGPTTATAKDLSNTNRTINTYLYQSNFYLWDASRPMFNGTIPDANGMIISYSNNNGDVNNNFSPKPISSSNNTWTDPASVSSMYNVGLIYNYYKNTHNRNSVDDNGLNLITVLHVTQGGQPIDNAWWNGKFVTLGDGNQITTAWAGALDFIAHEFTHGVVTFTVDLVYKFQSGALNEAIADWGGCMVDRNNWTLGEEIAKKSFFPTGCVRDMANPHNGGYKGDQGIWLPAHMNEYMNNTIDQDNGGVHYNCGIINKATYLIGTSITKEKLEKIYYRVLNNKYINKEAQFIDMRLACVRAAQELFGNTSAEVDSVKKAFDAVGITDGKGTDPNPDIPQVNGDEWIAVVATGDLSLYKIRSVINNTNTDIVRLSQTQMYINTGGVITVPDNGDFILFIDGNNFIRYIKSDGTGETVLSSQGNWASISISPDGKYLAAIALNSTTPQIYMFDIVNSTSSTIDVYVPSTTSSTIYKVPLAVASLSWNNNGKYLMYDSKNYELRMDGTEVIYWDINLVDIQKGVVLRVFPPQKDGIQVGDPSFSKNSEYLFVFDLYDETSKAGQINGGNLFNGELGTIFTYDGNIESGGYGSYSIDDRKVAFQYYNNTAKAYAVVRADLDSKKINSLGQPQLITTNCGLPKWFATGSRPTDVSENPNEKSNILIISPNPVTSECIFYINNPNYKLLNLGVYNLQGTEIINLTDKFGNFSGVNLFNWNCSNENGVRLSTGCYFVKLHYQIENGQIKTETEPLIINR